MPPRKSDLSRLTRIARKSKLRRKLKRQMMNFPFNTTIGHNTAVHCLTSQSILTHPCPVKVFKTENINNYHESMPLLKVKVECDCETENKYDSHLDETAEANNIPGLSFIAAPHVKEEAPDSSTENSDSSSDVFESVIVKKELDDEVQQSNIIILSCSSLLDEASVGKKFICH